MAEVNVSSQETEEQRGRLQTRPALNSQQQHKRIERRGEREGGRAQEKEKLRMGSEDSRVVGKEVEEREDEEEVEGRVEED